MMEVDNYKPWEGLQEEQVETMEEDAVVGDLKLKAKQAAAASSADIIEVDDHQTKSSVFLDPTKVSGTIIDVSGEEEGTESPQLGAEKENGDEISNAEGNGPEKQELVNVQETNRGSRNGKLENGSHSNDVHDAASSSKIVLAGGEEAEVTQIATIGKSANSLANWSGTVAISNTSMNSTKVHEIEVEKDESVIKDEENIEEYDLEKILDEQETHDLYCPNCKSCITRRVILRKRKRTVRQAAREEPPKKSQLAEPSANASNQTAAESHDQESVDVFRCLSCFTFFVPTGCDFNIFRIFERKDMNQQVQVQQPSASHERSDNCGSWILSCFRTDSPKNSADVDSAKKPLLNVSQSTDNKISSIEDNTPSVPDHAAMGDAKQLNKSLPAGSSSRVQTTTERSFGEFYGTTSSSVAQISSWTSETGSIHTTVQRDGAQQEKIALSKPADIQRNVAASSGNSLFFIPAVPELQAPSASVSKVLSEGGNLAGVIPIGVVPPPVGSEASPHLVVPIVPDAEVPPVPAPAPAEREEWDILKAIVYGGLIESITSLSVVSAAAASGAKTLDIFILGIANLIGGLPVIYHNIADLKNVRDVDGSNEQAGHYWEQLGRRSKHGLYMAMAMLSYILFGLLPPVVYGLSWRQSDDREKKMAVVAAASLACVALLAVGKAHVRRPPRTYITTLLYYLSIGLSASGLSYVAGVLITRLLARFNGHGLVVDQGPALVLLPDANAWASSSSRSIV